MTAPKDFPYSFRNLFVRKRDRIVFVASYDPSFETDNIISSTMIWDGASWLAHDSIPSNGTSFAMTSDPRAPIMLGKEGVAYLLKDSGGFEAEEIDSSECGPQHFGDMQDIRVVQDTMYVAGAARSVYKRNKTGKWTDIGESIRSDDDSDAGFMSIDGFDNKELYAVGFDGEIFWNDGEKWNFVEPLSNLLLYKVLCAPNGRVFACGQSGTLLSGRNNEWMVIRQDKTNENFWSCAWFNDQLYLSTDEGLICYDGSDFYDVELLNDAGNRLNIEKGTGFYRLESNSEVLYSMGSKAVIWTEDGVTWQEITYAAAE